MSPIRRLISLPRTIGTMQNVQELSQPIWIVTQAECGESRRTGSSPRTVAASASCSSLRIVWGGRLTLLANLSTEPATVDAVPEGSLLFETEPDLLSAVRGGTAPPWSTLWLLAA
jgi:hypothetical protein